MTLKIVQQTVVGEYLPLLSQTGEELAYEVPKALRSPITETLTMPMADGMGIGVGKFNRVWHFKIAPKNTRIGKSADVAKFCEWVDLVIDTYRNNTNIFFKLV